jgi:hypothetical protein
MERFFENLGCFIARGIVIIGGLMILVVSLLGETQLAISKGTSSWRPWTRRYTKYREGTDNRIGKIDI